MKYNVVVAPGKI